MHDAPRPSGRSNRPTRSNRARETVREASAETAADILSEPSPGRAARASGTGLRVADVLRAGAPSALALGVWTAVGGGCASAPTAGGGEEVRAPLEVANGAESRGGHAAPRQPNRVVFSDDPVTADGREPESTVDEPSGGLVSALASSYAEDQAALAAMEAARREPAQVVFSDELDSQRRDRVFSGEKGENVALNGSASGKIAPAPSFAERGGEVAPTSPSAANASATKVASVRASSVSPSAAATTASNETGAESPATGSSPTLAQTPEWTPIATAGLATTPVGDAVSAASPAPGGSPGATPATATTDAVATPSATPPLATTPALPTAANLPLEIVEPTPTEPAPLARLLAESLVRSSGESVEPLREWIAYSALALTDPSIALPADFGHDLLPAEKARVEAVHAAFVTVGRSLSEGSTELDPATIEALVAALGGGPKLAIPRVELCTKVERFGQFAPIASRKFLARSNARFIVYSELDGFSSVLEGGRFVTRLASRVSIETDRDEVEVWRRSPEWTAVVDASEVRRDEFFVAEIVPLNEYLSVGSYRLKVELRDEATGATATSTVPFHIVADPSMAAVGD